METIQLTKEQILLETIEYYSKPNTRAIGMGMGPNTELPGNCYYETDDGRHCAVGRCMTKSALNELCSKNHLTESVEGIYSVYGDIDHLLEERYRGHSDRFWTNLQFLHDGILFWKEDKLTYRGQLHVNKIIKEYELDISPYPVN